jgi:hypothetical protein
MARNLYICQGNVHTWPQTIKYTVGTIIKGLKTVGAHVICFVEVAQIPRSSLAEHTRVYEDKITPPKAVLMLKSEFSWPEPYELVWTLVIRGHRVNC